MTPAAQLAGRGDERMLTSQQIADRAGKLTTLPSRGLWLLHAQGGGAAFSWL